MTLQSEKLLDGVGWKLLALVQENARRPLSELGREIGLSAPAVAERLRRMEEAGIIGGYHAAVNPALVGWPLLAFVRLSGVSHQVDEVNQVIMETAEVLECHKLTGSDSYVIKVVVASMAHLEGLIHRFLPYAEVTTSLVLSSPVPWRGVPRVTQA
ncbi:MAG: Lrp/AsnC family transcriptional regulator [Chloroflexaceae bacterium]|jgi:Lrp/AsnC family leucine-responsive transcriptional regulator|nr:Lrp/AsnC family transcriptional regulator [Chloroflexaceae bacterium]